LEKSIVIEKIVLTGAAGKLARRMRAPLSQLCRQLVLCDIVPLQVTGNETAVQCDLTDAAAVDALLEGADTVVHFAGFPREAAWSTLIPANIISVTNLWEAALRNDVRRIVYASTNHVVGMYPVDRKVDVAAELKCDSRYGVTKAFTETVARFYYEKFGLESLGIRIGRCEDEATDERMLSTWIHPHDLANLVKIGIMHPVAADVVYGVSANSQGWCINPPYEQFPYRAEHSADLFAEIVAATKSSANKRWALQGGPFADYEYVGNPARAANFYRATQVSSTASGSNDGND
jgi:uronate dehydrogenase